ncbi:MAG: ATP-binding protein [Sphingomonadales bacterium]|nr:MAG: ATP-binding protein [Sphingomonadales bacterium]
MDPLRNPFVPGAGSPPPALIGRNGILRQAEIVLARTLTGRASKSLILTGLRGVGKTVLLNRIADMAAEKGYAVVQIEAPEAKKLPGLLIPPLRSLLFQLDRMEGFSESVKRGLKVLKGFTSALRLKIGEVELGLEIEPERGTADSGDLDQDLPELFVVIAEAARDRGRAIAILIDELQYLGPDELGALIMAVHRVVQKQLPLVLIGAGLPQILGAAGQSKSYAERLFEFPLVGPLPLPDAKDAIRKPVEDAAESITERALEATVEQTEGYPYFLQEWGYHLWDYAVRSPITDLDVSAINHRVIANLDRSFFRVRFDRLTPREKTYLRVMAELGPGPHRSGDIAVNMGAAVQSVAPLRNSLIKKGMIFSPAHGDTAFTVPLFDQFMKRIMPL